MWSLCTLYTVSHANGIGVRVCVNSKAGQCSPKQCMYYIQCTVYTVHCTVYTVQCTVFM